MIWWLVKFPHNFFLTIFRFFFLSFPNSSPSEYLFPKPIQACSSACLCMTTSASSVRRILSRSWAERSGQNKPRCLRHLEIRRPNSSQVVDHSVLHFPRCGPGRSFFVLTFASGFVLSIPKPIRVRDPTVGTQDYYTGTRGGDTR